LEEPAGASPLHPTPFCLGKSGENRPPRLQRPSLRLGFPALLVPGGCGIELPAFAALTAVRQQSRVSSRSALKRAPPCTALLGASERGNSRTQNSRIPNGPDFNLLRCFPAVGCWLLAARLFAPFGSAEQRKGVRRGREPASSTDSARLFDRSERSERREFRAGLAT